MRKHLQKKLHVKGWSHEEISRADELMKKADENKHPHVKLVESSVYWFTLCIGLLGTMLLSMVLIPVLIASNNTWSYILTGVFGFLLGSLIVMIVKDLHWLEHHHHLLLSLIIPFVAIFNFLIVVNKVNLFNVSIGLRYTHNPIIIAMVYLVCFIIPYAGFLLLKR
jgi:hypothetical protein